MLEQSYQSTIEKTVQCLNPLIKANSVTQEAKRPIQWLTAVKFLYRFKIPKSSALSIQILTRCIQVKRDFYPNQRFQIQKMHTETLQALILVCWDSDEKKHLNELKNRRHTQTLKQKQTPERKELFTQFSKQPNLEAQRPACSTNV